MELDRSFLITFKILFRLLFLPPTQQKPRMIPTSKGAPSGELPAAVS